MAGSRRGWSAHTGGAANAQALHQRILSQFVTHSAIQSITGAPRPGQLATRDTESDSSRLRYSVRNAEILVYSVIEPFKPRLQRHVAGEEEARLDLLLHQLELTLAPAGGAAMPQRQRISEPIGLRLR